MPGEDDHMPREDDHQHQANPALVLLFVKDNLRGWSMADLGLGRTWIKEENIVVFKTVMCYWHSNIQPCLLRLDIDCNKVYQNATQCHLWWEACEGIQACLCQCFPVGGFPRMK